MLPVLCLYASQSSAGGEPCPSESATETPGSFLFLFYLIGSFVLIAISGLMAGLTVGYMSLDPMNLKIVQKQGTANERRCVLRVRSTNLDGIAAL